MLKKIFIVYIRPKLEHASPVWSLHLRRYEFVRECPTVSNKNCNLSKGAELQERLAAINLSMLGDRRRREDMRATYMFHGGSVEVNMKHFFEIRKNRSDGVYNKNPRKRRSRRE